MTKSNHFFFLRSLIANTISPCLCPNVSRLSVKLVFWEGTTKTLIGGSPIAGEIMFEFPNMVVCHADSFFIGHPIPTLSIDDKLLSGETYFVLPIDRFACKVLSISSLASLVSSPKLLSNNTSGEGPFEYLKGADGKSLIKVSSEFLTKVISKQIESSFITSTVSDDNTCSDGILISTPELKQHYDKLVGYCKGNGWSPRLESISECKRRLSLIELLGKGRRSSRPGRQYR